MVTIEDEEEKIIRWWWLSMIWSCKEVQFFWGFSIESSIKLMRRRILKITLKLHTIPNQPASPQGGSLILLRTMMISLFLYSALSLLVLLPLITTNPVFLCKAPQWSLGSAYMELLQWHPFFFENVRRKKFHLLSHEVLECRRLLCKASWIPNELCTFPRKRGN